MGRSRVLAHVRQHRAGAVLHRQLRHARSVLRVRWTPGQQSVVRPLEHAGIPRHPPSGLVRNRVWRWFLDGGGPDGLHHCLLRVPGRKHEPLRPGHRREDAYAPDHRAPRERRHRQGLSIQLERSVAHLAARPRHHLPRVELPHAIPRPWYELARGGRQRPHQEHRPGRARDHGRAGRSAHDVHPRRHVHLRQHHHGGGVAIHS